MDNHPTGLPTPVGPPFQLPLLSPQQKLRCLIDSIFDCLQRALDQLPEEGSVNEDYIAKQLHVAYGLILDALVLDLGNSTQVEWPNERWVLTDRPGLAKNYDCDPKPPEATGERRGA